MAVLDEMDAADLMTNAATVGAYARTQMEGLAQKHTAIGNVRGMSQDWNLFMKEGFESLAWYGMVPMN